MAYRFDPPLSLPEEIRLVRSGLGDDHRPLQKQERDPGRRAELRDEAARLGASIFAPSPAEPIGSVRRAWESARAVPA